MLRTNKRKTVKPPRGRRAIPREVSFVDELQERARRRKRRAKRTVACESNRKKRKRGNPSRSAFYTSVHFPDRVKKFLRESNFFPDNKMIEKYTVDICPSSEDTEFYVRLDNNLGFIDIKFPNLRWCMVDLKRTWKARPNRDLRNDAQAVAGIRYPEGHVTHCNTRANDDIILDGLETDIRFLLHSRYEMSPQETRDTKYAQYQDVLRKGSQMHSGRPFCRQRRSMEGCSTNSFHQINKIQTRFSRKGFYVELDGLSWWSNGILETISSSRCFPETDHSMGIVYRSSASRRSNRKRNSEKVFAWTLEIFVVLIFVSLGLKRYSKIFSNYVRQILDSQISNYFEVFPCTFEIQLQCSLGRARFWKWRTLK